MTAADTGPPTVVLVEDDRVLRDVLAEVLGDEGYRVLPVAAWRQAHATIQAADPDVVLLDLMMDGQDTGWQVLNHLTLDPRTRDIPVILTTGAVEAVQPALLPQYGVSVLPKPFDLDALCTLVQAQVQRRSSLRAADLV
jgi:CheY-like chemotaxis protein